MPKIILNGVDYTEIDTDTALSTTSTNPLQNKIVTKEFNDMKTSFNNGLTDVKVKTYASKAEYETAKKAGKIKDGDIVGYPSQDIGAITVDDSLSTSSTNPIQNKAVTKAINGIKEFSPTTYNVTVLAASWDGTEAPYSIIVPIAKATESNIIEVTAPSTATSDQITVIANAMICSGTQTSGSITLKAYGEKPEIDLPLTVVVMN